VPSLASLQLVSIHVTRVCFDFVNLNWVRIDFAQGETGLRTRITDSCPGCPSAAIRPVNDYSSNSKSFLSFWSSKLVLMRVKRRSHKKRLRASREAFQIMGRMYRSLGVRRGVLWVGRRGQEGNGEG
jgi:hypothetical protein